MFQQVTAGARPQRGGDALGILVNGHHDDLHGWQQRPQSVRAFNAGHLRQLNIHQHLLGLFGGQFLQGLLRGRAGERAPKVGPGLDLAFQAFPNGFVIFDYGNANHKSSAQRQVKPHNGAAPGLTGEGNPAANCFPSRARVGQSIQFGRRPVWSGGRGNPQPIPAPRQRVAD